MWQRALSSAGGGGTNLTTIVNGSTFNTTGTTQTITVNGISKIHIVIMWQTDDTNPWYVFAIDKVNGSLYNDVRRRDSTLANLGVQAIRGNEFDFYWSTVNKPFNYYVIGE